MEKLSFYKTERWQADRNMEPSFPRKRESRGREMQRSLRGNKPFFRLFEGSHSSIGFPGFPLSRE
ncbi:MAG: hypothetical protein HQL51_05815 [Magnetococcales bacterium]|nr:hypothetical protein [Magnetococcales bacterium]